MLYRWIIIFLRKLITYLWNYTLPYLPVLSLSTRGTWFLRVGLKLRLTSKQDSLNFFAVGQGWRTLLKTRDKAADNFQRESFACGKLSFPAPHTRLVQCRRSTCYKTLRQTACRVRSSVGLCLWYSHGEIKYIWYCVKAEYLLSSIFRIITESRLQLPTSQGKVSRGKHGQG